MEEPKRPSAPRCDPPLVSPDFDRPTSGRLRGLDGRIPTKSPYGLRKEIRDSIGEYLGIPLQSVYTPRMF